MILHLVGGFLGSGKTTAIIQAAKLLIQSGKRVGVLTNDQGRYLVDTAFIASADIPVTEVSGGCFCCHYDDLTTKLDELMRLAKPEVIFAESVGSCADLVATVIRPLQSLASNLVIPSSLSIFTDSRLLLRWIAGEGLPFSDEVVYVFQKQIEEADLLVVNKWDLLSPAQQNTCRALLHAQFPEKPCIVQCSLEKGNIEIWLDRITSPQFPNSRPALDLDYDAYAAGERDLAWLDMEVRIVVHTDRTRHPVRAWLEALLGRLEHRKISIGHIKMIINSVNGLQKLSLTTLNAPNWWDELEALPGGTITCLLNARVETSAESLEEIVQSTLRAVVVNPEILHLYSFHPGVPQPTHRILDAELPEQSKLIV